MAEPVYDKDGRLTYGSARAVIEDGGSVMLGGGKHAATADELGPESEWVQGDPAAEAAYRERVQDAIRKLADEMKRLDGLAQAPAADDADAPRPEEGEAAPGAEAKPGDAATARGPRRSR